MTKYVSLNIMRGGAGERVATVPYVSVHNGGGFPPFGNTCMWISLSQFITRVLGDESATVRHLRNINGLRIPTDNNALFDTGVPRLVQGMRKIADEYQLTIHILLGNDQLSRFNPNSEIYALPIGTGPNHVYIVNFRYHYELVIYANSPGFNIDHRSRFVGIPNGGPGATALRFAGRSVPAISATSMPLTGRSPSFRRGTSRNRPTTSASAATVTVARQVPLSLHTDTQRAIDASNRGLKEREEADLQIALTESIQSHQQKNEDEQTRLAIEASKRSHDESQLRKTQDAELQRALTISNIEEQTRLAMEASRRSYQESQLRRAREASAKERDEALARDIQEATDLQRALRESEDAELARLLQQQFNQGGYGTDSLDDLDDIPIEYIDLNDNDETNSVSGCVIS